MIWHQLKSTCTKEYTYNFCYKIIGESYDTVRSKIYTESLFKENIADFHKTILLTSKEM